MIAAWRRRVRERIRGRFAPEPPELVADIGRAFARFRRFCRFEPETGCVVWTGGKTMGRGHHVPYGSFWYDGRRWFAHRWAAKFIHKQAIEGFQTDHCCPTIPIPNTLCVEHLQSITAQRNRELQHMRRMVYLRVGLIEYDEIYRGKPEPDPDAIPFFNPPAWLTEGPTDAERLRTH